MIGNNPISNDNGARMTHFNAWRNLVVESIYFEHKNICKGTWQSSDTQTIDQINHVSMSTIRGTKITTKSRK